jgi:hypothetical protein
MPSADSWAAILANNPTTPTPVTTAAAPSRSAQDAVIALTSGKPLTNEQQSFLGILPPISILAVTPPIVTGDPDNSKKDPAKPDNGTSTSSNTSSGPSSPVKVATPDLINAFSLQKYNDVPVDSMADILFEDLGGQELLNVSRTDLINGQNINYQPISNLGSISIENSPSNIIKLQSTLKSYFDSFPIVLEDYVPFVGTGTNGEIVYMDTTSGENIIIGAINMTSDKLVQVEFITYGNMINDIIYP